MKPIELKSTLVAGVIGAIALMALSQVGIYGDCKGASSPVNAGLLGFTIGAVVQIGVRLTGVS